MKNLLTAFRTLTIISWPGKGNDSLSMSLPWFPVTGFTLGLILSSIFFLLQSLPFSEWIMGYAIILVISYTLLTRGLHLDGLADWADSIGGFYDRERRLKIMKDSNLGTFGVLALILAIFIKVIIFERLLTVDTLFIIIPVLSISRSMQVELIANLPYARKERGMAEPFVNGATTKQSLTSHSICLAITLFFGPFGIFLFCIAFILTRICKKRFLKQFGGITGDLIGTANEIIEILLFIICCLAGEKLLHLSNWSWIL